jgi:hypothetical protein
MKYLKVIIIITLPLFTCGALFGQTDRPDSRRIINAFKKAFKESRRQGGSASSWAACNLDSQFYKKDTVYLIHKPYGHFNDCCEEVNWVFYKKYKCYITQSQSCREPASSRITTYNDMYAVSVIQKKAFADIKLTGYNNRIIKFTVLSIDSGNGNTGRSTIMTLVKIYESGSTDRFDSNRD